MIGVPVAVSVQLGLVILLLYLHCFVSLVHSSSSDASLFNSSTSSIPNATLRPFGSYPNFLLHLATDSSHSQHNFHPVVVFPRQCWSSNSNNSTFVCKISDYSQPNNKTKEQLLSPDEFSRRQRHAKRPWRVLGKHVRRWMRTKLLQPRFNSQRGYVGRYDEDRVGLYQSELFAQETCSRTVHVGVDLTGPVGTPVYSFARGTLHSAGYNPARGDYGHVVIYQYEFLLVNNGEQKNGTTTLYALYGHLDRHTNVPQRIDKGQIIAWMGGAHENGGWTSPHVHFQLSLLEPDLPHDLPGAVCRQDRTEALLRYPDPRYIVGNLH